jgi:hypothetical protein
MKTYLLSAIFLISTQLFASNIDCNQIELSGAYRVVFDSESRDMVGLVLDIEDEQPVPFGTFFNSNIKMIAFIKEDNGRTRLVSDKYRETLFYVKVGNNTRDIINKRMIKETDSYCSLEIEYTEQGQNFNEHYLILGSDYSYKSLWFGGKIYSDGDITLDMRLEAIGYLDHISQKEEKGRP